MTKPLTELLEKVHSGLAGLVMSDRLSDEDEAYLDREVWEPLNEALDIVRPSGEPTARSIWLPPDEQLILSQKVNAALRQAVDNVLIQSRTDGVALTSRPHPRSPWWRRIWLWFMPSRVSKDSLETIEIEIPEKR